MRQVETGFGENIKHRQARGWAEASVAHVDHCISRHMLRRQLIHATAVTSSNNYETRNLFHVLHKTLKTCDILGHSLNSID